MASKPLRPKTLYFSEHAATRMVERQFTTHDVKLILYTGDEAQSSYQPPKGPFRYARQLVLRGHPAKVIFADKPDRYEIITVEWVAE